MCRAAERVHGRWDATDRLAAAAFGPRPGERVGGVPPGTPAEQRWLAAVVLGGQGRYAAAAAVLEPMLADPAVPPVVAAHAAVTLAAHRRQLGGHTAARRLDALGLRWACGVPGLDARSAQVDALVGLAADALGTGDLRGSHRHLTAADRLLATADRLLAPQHRLPAAGPSAPRSGTTPMITVSGPSPVPGTAPRPQMTITGRQPAGNPTAGPPTPADPSPIPDPSPTPDPSATAGHSTPADPSLTPLWRPAVRADWVRAELALVEGRPADAVAPAQAALARAERAGAHRHVLKSRIVLAVARAAADPTTAPAAVAELDAAREAATAHRLLPLVWPAALAAADLLAGTRPRVAGDRRHTGLTTVSVLSAYTDPVGRRLMGESMWVPRVAVGSLTAPFGPPSPA